VRQWQSFCTTAYLKATRSLAGFVKLADAMGAWHTLFGPAKLDAAIIEMIDTPRT